MDATTTRAPKSIRVNMRIHGDLLKWAKKYAKKRHTNITQLVTDYFVKLKEKDKSA